MKINSFRTIFIITITIFFASNLIFAEDMRIVVGKASLTKSDKKRFDRYGNKISK